MDDLKKLTRSKARQDVLQAMDLHSFYDVVYHLPYRYETIEEVYPPVEDKIVAEAVVLKDATVFYKGRFSVLNVSCLIKGEEYRVTIFNRHFLKPQLKAGKVVTIAGKVKNHSVTASQIYLKTLSELSGMTPVYSLKEGLTSKDFQKYALKSLNYISDDLKDHVPYDFMARYHFMPKREALRHVHDPHHKREVEEALKYLKYEEFLDFQMTMQYIRMQRESALGHAKDIDQTMLDAFIAGLPFSLTTDQLQAVHDILEDLKQPSQMYRFLQGDVGSGKTVVSAVALYANALAGFQGVLMAPTEVLARQHYQTLVRLFNAYEVNIGLLTGALSVKEKADVYRKIEEGDYDIVVGTHALFQEKVTYDRLGLVITDEQHRFGVEQRKALKNKGQYVDFLIMSATPIPRTLALSLFGDMDVSTIHTMPSGRQPVITKYYSGASMKPFLKQLLTYLAGGGQVYVICPLIEENEDLDYRSAVQIYQAMQSYFRERYHVGLLHGGLKDEEKNAVMQAFQKNDIQILVATTVIEVGIDVKNANMMVIYDAQQFGLSQLHQLRGRVGRGHVQGYCYLLSPSKSEEAIARLKFLEDHHDGFDISRYDLEMRGPGEVLGAKQSGLPSFLVGHIVRDFDLLEKSREDAIEILMSYYKYHEYESYIEMVKEKITRNNEYID